MTSTCWLANATPLLGSEQFRLAFCRQVQTRRSRREGGFFVWSWMSGGLPGIVERVDRATARRAATGLAAQRRSGPASADGARRRPALVGAAAICSGWKVGGQPAGGAADRGRRRGEVTPCSTSGAAVVLSRWKAQGSGVGLVFPGVGSARLTKVNKAWGALMLAAELVDFRLHDCRHHFALRPAQNGVDLYAVKTRFGHSDFAMTQRYAHLAPDHLAAAVGRLDSVR